MGRLKSQRTVRSGTQTLHGKQNPLAGGAVNRRYAYDKAGNLIQSADQRSGVLNYIYDKIGRIQEARNSQTGRSETFAFDPAHNILDIPTSTPSPVGEGRGEGKTTAPISDDPKIQGRLKSPAKPNPVSGNRLKEYNGIEYTYDALGNLIYRQLPDGENQYYQYDLENQLVRAEIKKPAGNTEIWTYAYDPFGRRLSKERQDKLAWTSTDPKRTHFVWDGTRLLQEYTYKGSYTYIYTDQDSYEPLAQVFDNAKDGKQYLSYFHTDQIGIPREMTDIHGNLLWYGEYTAWGRLKKDGRVYRNAHQPFRLQNQYFDEETGLHYNLKRYYEPEAGRFVNHDPIGLLGGDNQYQFSPNSMVWSDPWGLARHHRNGAKASVTAGGNSTTHKSGGRHAEIKGLQELADAGKLRGQDVIIHNIIGYFKDMDTKENLIKRIGMCTKCRANIFKTLKEGGANSVRFPLTRRNKNVDEIMIDSSDFDKVRREISDLIAETKADRPPSAKGSKSDRAWAILLKYSRKR
ncbi:RHS repeat domain-containing protein [Neisseria sp. CP9]|uniref:RHS repeat domain-containing protein n=1 Tax=Neisseria sp. CP9 TaxID=3388843 RepID=UPI0039EFED86